MARRRSRARVQAWDGSNHPQKLALGDPLPEVFDTYWDFKTVLDAALLIESAEWMRGKPPVAVFYRLLAEEGYDAADFRARMATGLRDEALRFRDGEWDRQRRRHG